jgi:hypothetical protein
MLIGLFLAGGCIDPFTPKISETVDIMIINGRITDQEGFHFVEVSRTSTVYSSIGSYPVTDCKVEIEDDSGISYLFREIEKGIYRGWMEHTDLIYGNSYKLSVTTPEGMNYESGFEELLPCPPIEEISWDTGGNQTSNNDVSYPGIQFYITTKASGDYAKNYLWEFEETWRYLAPYPRLYAWDTNGFYTIWQEPSDFLQTCYRTLRIPEFYTYSTRNISGDYIRRIPINKVTNQTDRLSSRYSLLVKQYSLTDRAYNFWKALEVQAKQTGELYETQPVIVKGNIVSKENPEETVLGLFFAASVTENRIFIEPDLVTKPYCILYGFVNTASLEAFLKDEYPYGPPRPIYLYGNDPNNLDLASQSCFDCRLKGGSLIPPWFWED